MANGLAGMFQSFMNPGQAYTDAGNQYSKYYDQAQGYLQPYSQAGQGQIGNLTNATNNLLNPEQLQNQWASGYTESPYAQQTSAQATQSGLDSASQQGLMGSSAALNNVQNTSSNIMNSDRQSYLNDLMQKYQTGINTSQGIYNTGANAAGTMSGNAMNQGSNMGQSAFGANAAGGQRFQQLLGMGVGAYTGSRH